MGQTIKLTSVVMQLTYIFKRRSKENVVNNVDISNVSGTVTTEMHKNTQNTKTQQAFRINYVFPFLN